MSNDDDPCIVDRLEKGFSITIYERGLYPQHESCGRSIKSGEGHILTTYNEDAFLLRGLQAGACGYLLKDCPLETLLHTIRAAARGETLLQPEMVTRLLKAHAVPAASPPATTRAAHKPRFTERELEILAAIARGERSKEIAARLGLTRRTIETYLTTIYLKLEVDSRAAAVAVALEQGIVRPKES